VYEYIAIPAGRRNVGGQKIDGGPNTHVNGTILNDRYLWLTMVVVIMMMMMMMMMIIYIVQTPK
jgi:hypothetical protein